MMAGDREMRATPGLNDTQLMLARDAGDERGGSAITPPGPDGAGRIAEPIIISRPASSSKKRWRPDRAGPTNLGLTGRQRTLNQDGARRSPCPFTVNNTRADKYVTHRLD
jgi:hypothetical protein